MMFQGASASRRVALPFLRFTLTAPKPPSVLYPIDPETLGDHIRKKRMDLGLLQRDLAEIIGVNECTIHNWECSHSRPHGLMIPKIIRFLEYNPFTNDSRSGYPLYLETFGDHLLKKRLDEGITQNNLAQKMGVSVDAIRDWEKGRTVPQTENMVRIHEFLDDDHL